jgi:hypothetical protein
MSWIIVELKDDVSLSGCMEMGAMTNHRMLFPEPAKIENGNQGDSRRSEKGVRLP